jgi:hypothetical protein
MRADSRGESMKSVAWTGIVLGVVAVSGCAADSGKGFPTLDASGKDVTVPGEGGADGSDDAGLQPGTDDGGGGDATTSEDSGAEEGGNDATLPTESGTEGTDAGEDATGSEGVDAAPEAGVDAGTEAGEEAGTDAGTGTGPEAGVEAGADAAMEAAAGDAGSGVLLPLSRTGWSVSSNPTSADPNNAPANAIDGDLTTRFSTGATQQSGFYYQINLGGVRSFSQITLDLGGNGGDAAVGYSVTVSNDGTTWSAPVATGTGGVALITITFAEQTAQYVRVTQTGTSTAWWSIDEINVWAQQPLVVTPISGTHTALPRTAWVASAIPANAVDAASFAIDGLATTRYSPGQPQSPWQYLQVNLGSAQTFSQATIDAAGFGGDYPRAYEIFVSNDGTTWGSPIAVGLGSAQLITVQFPSQTSKYVRVSVADTQPSNYWSLAEFNLLQ